mmetsp:Transcript_20016/g.42186  ORF Transcript_20016/g.42186 Transcript_20016/m.42186 type:complete len:208 (-) Transcript_20016:263-886(-)
MPPAEQNVRVAWALDDALAEGGPDSVVRLLRYAPFHPFFVVGQHPLTRCRVDGEVHGGDSKGLECVHAFDGGTRVYPYALQNTSRKGSQYNAHHPVVVYGKTVMGRPDAHRENIAAPGLGCAPCVKIGGVHFDVVHEKDHDDPEPLRLNVSLQQGHHHIKRYADPGLRSLGFVVPLGQDNIGIAGKMNVHPTARPVPSLNPLRVAFF